MRPKDSPENRERIRRLESRVRELSFLNETGRLLTATLDLDDVLRSLMSQVREYFGAEAVSVALLDEEKRELVFRLAVGEAAEAVTGLHIPLGVGIAGWVTREGEPICIPDAYSDPRFYAGVDEETAFETRTVLAVPIQRAGKTLGALEALNPPASGLDEGSLRVLGQVADQAALAIANAELYDRARQAERRYERLFDGSPVPIYVMDFDGAILNVNRRGAELLGCPAEEIIGSTWHDVMGQQLPFASHLAEKGSQQDRRPDMKSSHEMTVSSPDGPRTLQVRTTTIDYGGQRAVQCIGHDVTELAELEQMRDDLMHMVVHDLQNPLSNIVGSLQLIDRAVQEGDTALPVLDVLHVALRSSRRLQRLIRSLLDLRQLEEGKADLDRAPASPARMVEEALEVIQPTIDKKDQSPNVHIPTDLPSLNVDQDMIVRVVTNLLSNATKYTQPQGKIELKVAEKGTDIVFTVSDNGPGIPLDAQSRIFERFGRLNGDQKTKGTGLGLPFCKLAVEAHGGEIWVESAPGEGSHFIFTLGLEGG
ncbi:MAG: ATP-binding protein [Chloroflexota bacterium]